ncbi:hypothetical protein FACS189460_1660 [Deltaproteobacteria bacterium]|nr:hypothetical protein FACS189460_1660 [Deltaproteobacteria bacterium]
MIRKIAPTAALFWLFMCAAPAGAGEFNYQNYDSALKTAEAEHKLVMVFFWADWCGFCNKIRREVFSDPKIHEAFDRDFIAVSVNIEKDPEKLAEKYRARVLPTLTFTDAAGQPVGFWEGATDQSTFLEILKYLTKEAKS